jgi:hypothetical protein
LGSTGAPLFDGCCRAGWPALAAAVFGVDVIAAKKFAGNGTGDSLGGIWIGCSADPSFLSGIPGTYLVRLKDCRSLDFAVLIRGLNNLLGLPYLLRLRLGRLRLLKRLELLRMRLRLYRGQILRFNSRARQLTQGCMAQS